MIDIKELMVGDWVDRSGTPPYYKVIGINSKTTEVLISQSGNDDETRKICWNDKLDPIPITPEILEKNGFKRTELCYEYREKLGGYMGQAVSLTTPAEIIYTDEGHCIVSNPHIGRVFQGSVDHVHELQHIIKSCELSKEIKL